MKYLSTLYIKIQLGKSTCTKTSIGWFYLQMIFIFEKRQEIYMKNMFHIRLKCGSGPDDNIRWKLFYECDNFIFYILQLWHTLYSIELSWTIKTTTTTTVKRLTIYIESPYCFYLYYAVCSNAVCTGIEPFHKTKYECTFCKCSKQTDDRVGYLHLNKTQYTQSVRWSRNKTTKYAELLTYYFVNCIDIFFLLLFRVVVYAHLHEPFICYYYV